MAPKPSLLASSHSLSSFPLSHPPKTLTPHKPPPISCRSLTSTEPDGIGVAAPIRGDVFLDRLQSRSTATVTIKHNKQNSTRKHAPSAKTSPGAACCYGCGAPLHTGETDAPGYVDPDTYELKKRHRQLRTVLCGRCRLLSHGHMVTAVGWHGVYAGGKQFVTAEELREKLLHLRHEKALIVKLACKYTDMSIKYLIKIRRNQIHLIILQWKETSLGPKKKEREILSAKAYDTSSLCEDAPVSNKENKVKSICVVTDFQMCGNPTSKSTSVASFGIEADQLMSGMVKL